MRELFQQYFNIAFLMGKPQDLPSGRAQMQIGIALALITYLLALMAPVGLFKALMQAGIDLSCSALVMWVALNIVGHPARFQQAFGGLCGASAFINLAALPLYVWRPSGIDAAGSPVSTLADFVLLVWGLSLLAHVIRHTFEVKMAVSVLVSFVYFIVLSTLIAAILPQTKIDNMSSVSFLGGAHAQAVSARSESPIGSHNWMLAG